MPRDDYHDRQQARQERLEARADKAEAEGKSRLDVAGRLAACMNGTPILVGHHSERRHRRDIEKMDRNMSRGVAEIKKAEELRRRAANVGAAGISSDDPEAVRLLERKLDALLLRRDRMKAINRLWRKTGKPAPDDQEGWSKVAELLDDHFHGSMLQEARLNMARDFLDRAPFPSYALTNLGARIRTATQRIEALKVEAERQVAPPQEFAGGQIVERPDLNRVTVVFGEKPSREVCKLMRQHGFRFSRQELAWMRQLNNAGRHAAEYVVQQIVTTAAPW